MKMNTLKLWIVFAFFGLMSCQKTAETTEDTSTEDQMEAEQLEEEMKALEEEMAADSTSADSSDMSHP